MCATCFSMGMSLTKSSIKIFIIFCILLLQNSIDFCNNNNNSNKIKENYKKINYRLISHLSQLIFVTLYCSCVVVVVIGCLGENKDFFFFCISQRCSAVEIRVRPVFKLFYGRPLPEVILHLVLKILNKTTTTF